MKDMAASFQDRCNCVS